MLFKKPLSTIKKFVKMNFPIGCACKVELLVTSVYKVGRLLQFLDTVFCGSANIQKLKIWHLLAICQIWRI